MFDSREAIAVYRGWDALEKNLPESQRVEVIDFDLVPEIQDTEHFENRREVLARILELRDSIEVIDETSEFLQAKLCASGHYLRALEGEQFEFYEHVRAMLGITPELIPEDAIGQQQAIVVDLLGGLGVPSEDGQPVKQAFSAFEKAVRIYEEEAAVQAELAEQRFLPTVLSLLGMEALQVSHQPIEFVRERAYWRGWSSGTRGSFLLRYNFHPNHLWRQGDMEFLTLHEVCGHFVHAASLAREIQEGRLDPFIGITVVHDPHGFMGEGIADAMSYFFPKNIRLSPYGVLACEQYKWRDYLNNNAHILVNMGWPEGRLLRYLLSNPFTPRRSAALNLDRWRTSPLFRAYQYAYGISRKYHERFAADLTHEQKIAYLRWAFTRYVTPRRVIEYLEELTGT